MIVCGKGESLKRRAYSVLLLASVLFAVQLVAPYAHINVVKRRLLKENADLAIVGVRTEWSKVNVTTVSIRYPHMKERHEFHVVLFLLFRGDVSMIMEQR